MRREARQRIVGGRVGQAADHDALRRRPQRLRRAALVGAGFEPAHVAVIAAGEELGELVAYRRAQRGGGKADRVEAERQGALPDRVARG